MFGVLFTLIFVAAIAIFVLSLGGMIYGFGRHRRLMNKAFDAAERELDRRLDDSDGVDDSDDPARRATCKYCGASVGDGERCRNCGAPVE